MISQSTFTTLETATTCNPITRSGLIAGGREAKKGRQTAVNPMDTREHGLTEFDLMKPRIAVFRQKWKVHQNSVYWVNLKLLRERDWSSTRPGHSSSVLHRNGCTLEDGRSIVQSNVQFTAFTTKNHTENRFDKKTN